MLRPEPAEGELRLPLGTEAIWDEFHARLRAYVGRRVRAGAEVDDVVQKIFPFVPSTASPRWNGVPMMNSGFEPSRLQRWISSAT